jgi:hypothetical protein
MMDKIFRLCDARSATHKFTVFISMVEIYNDEVCAFMFLSLFLLLFP